MRLGSIRKTLLGSEKTDEYLENYTERLNANIGVYAGSWLAIMEAIMAIASAMRAGEQFTVDKFASYIVLAVLSAALAVVSLMTLRQRIDRHLFTAFLMVYLYAVAGYAILNTLEDFLAGEQCFTFLAFMMVDACIFATPPLGTFILVVVSYATMYGLAFSGGRLDAGSLVNFFLSGVVVLMAGYVRFRECRIGAERERELESVGSHDALTGLKNRMALRGDFPTLVGRDQYVAMADLDDFKGINDTYGHEAGDAVLEAYGFALSTCFPQASVYRYGGDEFLLFVPKDSVTSMEEGMAQVRSRVGSIAVASGEHIVAGASVGWVDGIATNEQELRDLVHAADQRLYEMKAERKGRVSQSV